MQGVNSYVRIDMHPWKMLRHAHPAMSGESEVAGFFRTIASDFGGDFGVALAARNFDLSRGGSGEFESHIDIMVDGQRTETAFGIKTIDGRVRAYLEFTPPGSSERRRIVFDHPNDYARWQELSLRGDAGMLADLKLLHDNYVAAQGSTTAQAAARHELSRRAREMRLLDQPDGFRRLQRILNDERLDPDHRGILADAVLGAHREDLIRAGQLGADEPLYLIFEHSTSPRERQALESGSPSTRRAGESPDDGTITFARDFATARAMLTGTGDVLVPRMVRGRDIARMVDPHISALSPNQQLLMQMRWRRFLRDRAVLLRMMGLNAQELEHPAMLRTIAEGHRPDAQPVLEHFFRELVDGNRPRADLVVGMFDGAVLAQAHLLPPIGTGGPQPQQGAPTLTPAPAFSAEAIVSHLARTLNPDLIAQSADQATAHQPVSTADRIAHFATALDLIGTTDGKASGRFLRTRLGLPEADVIAFLVEADPVARAQRRADLLRPIIAADGATGQLTAQIRRVLDTYEGTYGNALRELTGFLARSRDVSFDGLDIPAPMVEVVRQSRAARHLAQTMPEFFAEAMQGYARSLSRRTSGITDADARQARIAELRSGGDFEQFLARSLAQRTKDSTSANDPLVILARELRGLSAKTENFSRVFSKVIGQMRAEGFPAPLLHHEVATDNPRQIFDQTEPLSDFTTLLPGHRIDDPEHGRGTVMEVDGDSVLILFDRDGERSVVLDPDTLDQSAGGRRITVGEGRIYAAANDDGSPVQSIPFRDRKTQEAFQARIDHERNDHELTPWKGETSHGTAAIAVADVGEALGTSSLTSARLYELSLDDRRILASNIGLIDNDGVARNFLSHAETMALLKLRRERMEIGLPMPGITELFVDRPLCSSCQADLHRVAGLLGIKELRVYFRDRTGKPPIIIKGR